MPETSHDKDNTLLSVGVPRESYPDERRVGLVPMVVPHLLKAGLDVVIEAGTGVAAGYAGRADGRHHRLAGPGGGGRTAPSQGLSYIRGQKRYRDRRCIMERAQGWLRKAP
jgi:hypothetical protein